MKTKTSKEKKNKTKEIIKITNIITTKNNRKIRPLDHFLKNNI